MRTRLMLCAAASIAFAHAALAEPTESKEMFAKAGEAIVKFMPHAELAYYYGQLSSEVGCTDKMNWRFVFHEDGFQGRPSAGGWAEYKYFRHIDGSCRADERVLVDTQMDFASYYYLARNGNLNKVNLEWADAVKVVKDKYPDFEWKGVFEVYSPLVPVLKDHVFYAVPGTMSGQPAQIIVDAATGEIQEQ